MPEQSRMAVNRGVNVDASNLGNREKVDSIKDAVGRLSTPSTA